MLFRASSRAAQRTAWEGGGGRSAVALETAFREEGAFSIPRAFVTQPSAGKFCKTSEEEFLLRFLTCLSEMVISAEKA